jgi:hypothetical protein
VVRAALYGVRMRRGGIDMFGDGDNGYRDTEDNDTSPWIMLDVSRLEANNSLEPWRPIAVLAKRYKSSSPDSEKFIHNPLRTMMSDADDPTNDANAREALGMITEDWHVITTVVNHHLTLSIRHVSVIAALNPENPSIGLMIIKQKPEPPQ